MTVTHSGVQNDIVTQNTSSLAMPQVFVSADVTVTTPGTTSYDNGGVGLVKDQNNFIFASVDRLAGSIRVQIKIGGTTTFLSSSSRSIPGSFRLGLSLVGTSAETWIDTGSGWVFAAGADISAYYDTRTVGNLTGWKAGFTLANGGGSSVWQFANLNLGRFGGVGIRDLTLVTNEDGSAVIFGGNSVMLTATLPDSSGSAAMGVISLNLSTGVATLASIIMVSRGGKIYGDLSGHIIWYANGNRRMLIGTWGNGFGNSLQTLHELFTSGDILSGSNVVSGMATLALPQSGVNPGAYDAMMVFDSVNSRWLIGYAITENTNFVGNPFYAAAAYSSDLSTWTAIGADSGVQGYEGAKIVKNSGQYHVLVGGPAGSGNSSRIYTQGMVYEGALAFTFSGGTDTQPHPMVFPVGATQYLVTFDNAKYQNGAFSWGRLQVAQAPRYY